MNLDKDALEIAGREVAAALECDPRNHHTALVVAAQAQAVALLAVAEELRGLRNDLWERGSR